MRILSALKYDVLFQFRHGFYYAYALVTVFYIIVIKYIPVDYKQLAAVLIIFSDPAALGLFLVGGIVLLEKDQMVLSSLFVTPLRLKEYLLSRVLSLTIIAELVSLIIVISNFGMVEQPLLLLSGVALSSIFFTLVGLALVARIDTINGYITLAPLLTIPLVLPSLDILGIFKSPFFYLIPSQGSLILLRASFGDFSPGQIAYAFGILFVWIIIAYNWASSSFKSHVIQQIGGGSQ